MYRPHLCRSSLNAFSSTTKITILTEPFRIHTERPPSGNAKVTISAIATIDDIIGHAAVLGVHQVRAISLLGSPSHSECNPANWNLYGDIRFPVPFLHDKPSIRLHLLWARWIRVNETRWWKSYSQHIVGREYHGWNSFAVRDGLHGYMFSVNGSCMRCIFKYPNK